MGLSLTAEVVGWVLVDGVDGAVLDHDVLEVTDSTETAGAAALGAHAIAVAAGLEVSCVRITWSDDAVHAGRRLQTRMRTLALAPVEVVSQHRAMAVLVGPENADLPSDIALAYGAAIASVDPSVHDADADADAQPVVGQRTRRLRPRRLATSVLGVAAALALGVFGLGAAGSPDIAPAATAVEQPAPAAPGWVAVPVAPNRVAEPARKVVSVPARAAAPAAEAPAYYPVQAVAPVAEAAPAPAPAALPEPEGLPHLSTPVPDALPHIVDPLVPHAPGPQLGVPHHAPAPTDEMTVSPNLFTALP